MPVADHLKADMDLVTELGLEAGAIGMAWFGKDPEVWMKEGQSPVSEADYAIDVFLKEKLLAARPDYGWLSEETDDDKKRLRAKRTFVVDPIDGTRGFIAGQEQWCVSIAIVEDNRPIVGVLECPALKETITASADGGTYCNGRPVSANETTNNDGLRVTGPRSFQTATGMQLDGDIEKLPFVPSLAYRLAMIAMGTADLSLARGSAKDWDLAAADLVVHEAGAKLSGLDGEPLKYNCKDVRHGPLVASAAGRHNVMLDLAQQAMDKQDRKA